MTTTKDKNKMSSQLAMNAVVNHWAAQRDRALFNLSVLFNKAVGIGEHADLTEELVVWSEKLAQAEDVLSSLDRNREKINPRLDKWPEAGITSERKKVDEL